MITDDWRGLYNEGWKNKIVPEAISHPAKFSRSLIEHIYQHAIAQGWLKAGSKVIDPFAGVSLGSLDCAKNGIIWVGVELELRFNTLALHNTIFWIEENWCTCHEQSQSYLHELRNIIQEREGRSKPKEEAEKRAVLFDSMQKHLPLQGEEIISADQGEIEGEDTVEQGQALVRGDEGEIVQSGEQWKQINGEERQLERGKVHRPAGIYSDSSEWTPTTGTHVHNGTEDRSKDIQERGGSPQERESPGQQDQKFAVNDNIRTHAIASSQWREAQEKREEYGRFCPNCGKMIVPFPLSLQGDSRHLLQIIGDADASISSPPYAETQVKFTHMTSTNRTDPNDPHYRPSWVKKMEEGYADSERPYGETPGQLGTLKDEGYDAAISSPPYAETRIDGKGDEGSSGLRNEDGSFLRGSEGWQKRKEMGERYGETEGNLGNLKDNGFDAAISSPPFIAQTGGTNVTSKEGPLSDERLLKRHAAGNAATEAYGDDPANLGNLRPEGYDAAISSPPYLTETEGQGLNIDKPDTFRGVLKDGSLSMGDSPDNLGNMNDGGYDAAIASPPFAESNPDGGWQLLGKYAEEGRLTVKQVNGDPNKSYPSWNKDRETPYAMSPDNLGNMRDQGFDAAISSPPYSERHSYNDDRTISAVEKLKEDPDSKIGGVHIHDNAGQTPGNLGNMTPAGFDAAISSPPYAETEVAADLKSGVDVEERKKKRAEGGWEGYNRQNPANLGSLKAEGFDASVSSPPWENTEGSFASRKFKDPEKLAADIEQGYRDGTIGGHPASKEAILRLLEKQNEQTYGNAEGQLGQEKEETFWSAARTILDQTYAALKPGGVAIWVTKSFVKDGKRVDFPGQWQRMCEAAGFVTLHRHKAWLVEDRGSQFDIFGELHEKKVERKSFFRRLAEKKGSPRIDYEVVTCMMKPK